MNEQKFNTKGSYYSKARPLYPTDLIDWMTETGVITNESVVADIGSGTGIFTMQVQPLVKKIFAVEPNKSMQNHAAPIFKNYNNVVPICASAEETTLESQSIDCITSAQSFHWFDRSAFQKECRRILKPNGKVVLLWNERDMSADIIARNSEMNTLYCEDYHGFSNGMVFDELEFRNFFQGDYRLSQFENTVKYDLETFIERNLSSSFAPQADHPQYAPYVLALTELFHEFSSFGMIEYPYTTRCYVGTI